MRVGRLVLVGDLDVAEFVPAYRCFLGLHTQGVPAVEVVGVALDDHVAAVGVGGILVADVHSCVRRLVARVGRTVDETEKVTFVEVAEAVDLVHHVGVTA